MHASPMQRAGSTFATLLCVIGDDEWNKQWSEDSPVCFKHAVASGTFAIGVRFMLAVGMNPVFWL